MTDYKILLTALVLITLISACTMQYTVTGGTTVPAIEQEPDVQLTVTTDRTLYHSNEVMNIYVNTDSTQDITAVLTVKGINSRLNEIMNVSLIKGANNFNVEFTTPRCNTCSGIKEGTYDITAELVYGNKTIASAITSAEIKQ